MGAILFSTHELNSWALPRVLTWWQNEGEKMGVRKAREGVENTVGKKNGPEQVPGPSTGMLQRKKEQDVREQEVRALKMPA